MLISPSFLRAGIAIGLVAVASSANAQNAQEVVPASALDGAQAAAPPSPPPVEPAPALEKPVPASPQVAPEPPAKKEKHWYDKLKLRGYTQFRFSRTVGDETIKFDADKSVSSESGFLIRRARLILQGDPFDILSVYLQPDFAGAVSGDIQNVAAIRDWYGDIFLDPSTKQARIRVGQQKVPFGWENMQSSSNRLNIDRSEGLNSAAPGERDLGIFLYLETTEARALYQEVLERGLKGSGDYGVIGVGVTNGQTINKKEANDDRHVYARLNYPFRLGSQIMEVGAYGYTGQIVVSKDDKVTGIERSVDQRIGASFVLYPQPIGFQAEYNVGRGPTRRGNTLIASAPLDGGYAMLNARMFESLFPFVRVARYEGGRKEQLNAPEQKVTEVEGGLEYTFFKAVELTLAANYSERTTNGKPLRASVFRAQLQLNY